MLLYTILVASLVLLFALGITNTAYKEAVLSSSARDAGYSFFAADSGVECALFMIYNPGSSSCFGFDLIVNMITAGSFDSPDGYCINVTNPSDGVIEVRGYNLPCNQKDVNPRSVERAIRVSGLPPF